MVKCLVTGGAGFIGSHVVDALVEAGYGVTIIDNFVTGKEENLNPLADIWADDITEIDWDNVPEFDYVFHLAALARIQPSIDDPKTAHDTNLTGTLQVLEYCRQSNAKFIFSGSSSIYRGDSLPTKESDIKDPQSPYALQKLQCEEYIRMYARLYHLDYSVLRYFNVFGERQITDGAYAAVVGIFLEQLERGEKLTITNDGQQKRDFTYVKDVAKANMLAMHWQGTFNIGTGKSYSINQLADFVGGQKKYIGERIGEARNTLADNSRAVKQGWLPSVDIKDWIYDYLKR